MAIESTKPAVAISQSSTDNNVVVASSALPTGAATGTKQDTGNTSLASIDGKITAVNTGAVVVSSSALPTGAATETTLGTRLSESDFDTKTGSLTEAAPVSDTASSGLNGRLQRVAQRITSLIALLPAALGAGGGLKVDGSGTALPVSGTVSVNLNAGTNNVGDVDVLTVPADPFGANADAVVAAGATGSIQAKLRRATQGLEDLKSLIVLAAGNNNIGDVDVVTVPADPFGANADAAVAAGAAGSIQGKLRRATQGLEDLKTSIVLATGTNVIGGIAGDVAHDGVDSGNPLKVGAKAISSLAGATLVASADRTNNQSDLDGVLISRGNVLGDLKSDRITDTAGASVASAVFAAVAGTKNYICGATVFRTDAGTSMEYVDFRDGTGGAVLWTLPLPPGGGAVLPRSAEPWFKTSANTALAYDVSNPLTTVIISASGFQSKV